MKRISILCIVLFFSIAASAQIHYLKGILEGSQEVPPTPSTGTGVVIVKYDMGSKTLQLTGNFNGLTDTVSNSHIHLAGPGISGPVIIPLAFTGSTSGTISGTATLTQQWEDSLLAGKTYVNVHSKAFAAGELRAQLTTATDNQTEYFTGRIQGAQQVPPNPSAATGSVTVLLDRATLEVFVTGSFHGLTSGAVASHIHRNPAGTNGPVIVPLSATADTSGIIFGTSTVSASFADSMIAGDTYVNIHSVNNPGGEIRGQLTRLPQMYFLKAVLQGSQQVPPNASTARGTVIVKYNPATRILELIGDYQNLTAPIDASHIHSPAPVGSNASVLVPLNNTGGTSGVVSGGDTLSPSDEANLLGGLMYVNVHNATYPGGEIRGQLTTTSTEAQYFKGNLQGAQQVPSNSSSATGSVTALLDKTTNEVFLTGDFHGLVLPAAAAHIHRGAAGTNGDVIVELSATADTSGTITGTKVVTQSFADSMILGLTYVNIHNAEFPGGEIRAQLGDLVLPVKLKYFNGYKQNNRVALVWESAQEENLKNYQIEQLANENWITKAAVPAKGGSVPASYSFIDNPVLGESGYVFYRLKMTDNDGRFSYSPVIKINFEKSKAELTITANPVSNGILRYIITGLSTGSKAEVAVIDYNGKVVARSIASSLTNNTMNVKNLPSGVYRLIVHINKTVLQQSFIK